MWFFLILFVAIAALAIWMWKRPDPVVRDQAKAEQHDLWLEQVDAQMQHAARLLEATPPNYERAYSLFQDLAKQHELPQAYKHMGLMHWRGQGREVNEEHALGYLEKAFRLGSDDAAYALGQFFEQKQDQEKVLYWYRHAVARGNLEAQYRLAELDTGKTEQSEQQRFELLKQNAGHGHAQSQYQLSQYYFDLPSPNIQLGLEYLFLAAEQQHVAANQKLYECYERGRYVEANRKQALVYLKRAIELGEQTDLRIYQQAVLMGDIDVDQRQRVHHDLLKQGKELKQASAKALLGDAHFHGWYLDKNETLGYRFWVEAAQDQDPHALRQLAALHAEQHEIVGADSVDKAFVLYSQAENIQPHINSQMGLALCYLKGIGVEKDVAQAQALITQAVAKHWQYAVKSEADLYMVIGRFYQQVDYPLATQDKAMTYFKHAMDLGSADAAWHIYHSEKQNSDGLIPSETVQTALKASADLNHVQAQRLLAQAYLKGDVVEQNMGLAVHYFEQAAAKNDAVALNALGEIYEKGLSQDADLSLAVTYYEKAAALLNADALNHLGRLYIKGEGVMRDLQQAQVLLKKASAMQHVGAQEQLANIQAYFAMQESKF